MASPTLVTALQSALTDSYRLLVKTQSYHWNVEGEHFGTLNRLFEEQYVDLGQGVMEIAELIRCLGMRVNATFDHFSQRAHIGDADFEADTQGMLRDLSEDQDKITQTLQTVLKAAREADDEIIANAIIARMAVHRKNKWTLASSLA